MKYGVKHQLNCIDLIGYFLTFLNIFLLRLFRQYTLKIASFWLSDRSHIFASAFLYQQRYVLSCQMILLWIIWKIEYYSIKNLESFPNFLQWRFNNICVLFEFIFFIRQYSECIFRLYQPLVRDNRCAI